MKEMYNKRSITGIFNKIFDRNKGALLVVSKIHQPIGNENTSFRETTHHYALTRQTKHKMKKIQQQQQQQLVAHHISRMPNGVQFLAGEYSRMKLTFSNATWIIKIDLIWFSCRIKQKLWHVERKSCFAISPWNNHKTDRITIACN